MTRLLLALGVTAGLPVLAAGNAAQGRQLHQAQCGSCHLIDANDIGPAHRGVYGRPAASLRNFDYSLALRHKARSIVWNDETLDAWLAGPERFAPGQSMGVSVKDPQARADLIAYLRTLERRR